MPRHAWPQRLGNLVREQIVRLFGFTTSRAGWAQRLAVALLVVMVVALGARSENRRATAEVGIIDGNTWLTSRSSQEVVLVNSATGEVTARTELGSSNDETNQLIIGRTVGNDAVVLEAATGNISLISGATLEPIASASVPGAVGADQLLAAGDLVHVVNSANTSGFTLDRANLFVVGSFAFPSGSTAAITRSGELWVASPHLGGIEGSVGNVRVSGANESATYLIGDDGDVPGLTTLGDDAIVLNRSSGRLTYPESGRTVEVCGAGLDLGRVMVVAAADVVLDTELLILIDPITGRISGTDLDTGDCVPLEDIGDGPWGRPVSNGRFLYVAQSSEGVVAAIDTSSADVRIIQSIAPNGDLDLLADDGAVWFNDLEGPDAGLFSGLEIGMRTRKYAISTEKSSAEGRDRPSLTPDSDVPISIEVDGSEEEGSNGLSVGTAEDGESSIITPNADRLPAIDSVRSDTSAVATTDAVSTVGALEPVPKVGAGESDGATTTGLTGETTNTSRADAAVAPSSSVTSALAANRPAVTTSDIGASLADALQPVPAAGSPDVDEPVEPVDEGFNGGFTATFEYSPDTNVASGEEVVFEAKASGADDSEIDYTWDFGDGLSAIGTNVSHAWSKPGDYLVTMTARSGERTVIDSTWFTVFERDVGRPPSANFEYSTIEASPGGRIKFSDESTGDPSAWRWDFGDGTSGIGESVSHTWSTPARYLVTLTVSNEYGSDSTSVQVIIGEPIAPPKALILPQPQSVSVGETITFRAVGANNRTTNISWDFGDGNRGQGFEIEHIYEESGPKRVVLTLVNPSGRSQDVEEILVTPRPSATTSAMAPVQSAETVPTTAAPLPVAESTLPTVPARPATEQSTSTTALPASTSTNETVPPSTSPPDTAPPETASAPSSTAQAETTSAPSSTDTTTTTTRDVPSTTTPGIERPEVPRPTSTTTTRPTTTTTRPTTTTTRPTTTTTRPTTTTTRPPTTTAKPTTTTTRPPTTTTTVKPTTTTTRPPTTTTAKATTTAAPPTTRPPTTTTQDAVPSDAIGDVAGDHQVEVGELVQFKSDSTGSYEWLVWTFGDGNQSMDMNPTHRYTKPGIYWASVTVGSGSQTEDSDPVRVEVVPASNNNADATSPLAIEPNPVEVGEAVRFISNAVGDTIVTKWIVDGQELQATGERFVWHTFNSPGTRTVRMELCEAANVSNCWFVTADVEVLPDPNKDAGQTRQKDNNGVTVAWRMDGGADATTIIAGAPVTFSDISDPRPLALEWEIEGRNSTDRSATFTFDQPGDVSFRLTVVTNDGRTAVMDRTLTVVGVDGPTARIEAPLVAQAGETVYFADVSPGSAKGRTWEFGDGETSFDQRPEHIFWTPGTYTVLLTVWNDFGENSTQHSIEIYE